MDNSKAGYTTKELATILHVRVNDLLRIQSEKDTVIAILVAIISCERGEQGEVLHRLRASNRQLEVDIPDIEAVISHYGLKKTAFK